jgi:hypothetical protein
LGAKKLRAARLSFRDELSDDDLEEVAGGLVSLRSTSFSFNFFGPSRFGRSPGYLVDSLF